MGPVAVVVLDVLVDGPLQAENLDGPEEGEIEEREGHGPFSPSSPLQRMVQLKVVDEVLGTHRIPSRRLAWCPASCQLRDECRDRN